MGNAPGADQLHPATHFVRAREFFCSVVGFPPEWIEPGLQRVGTATLPTSIFRPLYQSLLNKEQTFWECYLSTRLLTRGWNADMCLAGLRSLPRSVPQGHRWHLLKLHLNGHYSSACVQRAGVTQDEGHCCFCRHGPDSVSHIMSCPNATTALEGLAWTLPVPASITLHDLFFQQQADGAIRSYMLAAFAAVWAARFKHADATAPVPPDVLVSLIQKIIQCPWIECFLPTANRKERRALRIHPPPPVPGAYIFRSDGASKRSKNYAAGWGAAYWSPEGILLGTARGYLGIGVTNNIAEYCGLEQVMQRALEITAPMDIVVFEVDSALVARQVQVFGIGKCACRSLNLRPSFLNCVRLGWRLTDNQIIWQIRHIYREFNQVADSLANEAIDRGDSSWPAP